MVQTEELVACLIWIISGHLGKEKEKKDKKGPHPPLFWKISEWSISIFLICLAFVFNVFVCIIYSGLAGGEDNGQRGYNLTYAIAYLRVRTKFAYSCQNH